MASNMDPDQTPPWKQYKPSSGFIVLASKVKLSRGMRFLTI